MTTITTFKRITPANRHFANIKERFEQRRQLLFTPAYRIAFREKKKVIRRYKITDIPSLVMHDHDPICRKRELVIRRQIGMSIAHVFCGTLEESGRLFQKDHSTVLHAIKALADAVQTKDYRVMPLLINVFGKFYKQHLFEVHNYKDLSEDDKTKVDTVKYKLRKIEFAKMLISKEVA